MARMGYPKGNHHMPSNPELRREQQRARRFKRRGLCYDIPRPEVKYPALDQLTEDEYWEYVMDPKLGREAMTPIEFRAHLLLRFGIE